MSTLRPAPSASCSRFFNIDSAVSRYYDESTMNELWILIVVPEGLPIFLPSRSQVYREIHQWRDSIGVGHCVDEPSPKVNRVTIRSNKVGQPKGYAYVEFLEPEAVQEAILLNESELHGRH